MNDNIDDLIKKSLEKQAREITGAQGEWEKESVPPDWIASAKALGARQKSASCPHCGKPITAFKKPLTAQKWTNFLWLSLASASFGLSFVFRGYFMQFLLVAMLAGIKAIVELRATKTQILIYKALSEEQDPTKHRLQHHL